VVEVEVSKKGEMEVIESEEDKMRKDNGTNREKKGVKQKYAMF